jgi:hypothetical protein
MKAALALQALFHVKQLNLKERSNRLKTKYKSNCEIGLIPTHTVSMEYISSKSLKTPVIEEDINTINAGAATCRTSTDQPAILAKEQHQSDTNTAHCQEPKSKEAMFHLIGHVNGVSVHYLRTILLQEVRDAGFDEDTATVYNMEDLRQSKHGIIRSKGAQHTCPRDEN